jgi:hypothetical protein
MKTEAGSRERIETQFLFADLVCKLKEVRL